MIEFVEEFEARFRKQYEACGEDWLESRLRRYSNDRVGVMYEVTNTQERFLGFVDGKKTLAPSVPQVPLPIESAPKDGTAIFAYDAEFGRRFACSPWQPAFWSESTYSPEEMSPRWCQYDDTHDDLSPTHWLPLPPPPGEVAPQVCPNCEEIRQILEVLANGEICALAELDYEVAGREQVEATDAYAQLKARAKAALSTLKNKEPQN